MLTIPTVQLTMNKTRPTANMKNIHSERYHNTIRGFDESQWLVGEGGFCWVLNSNIGIRLHKADAIAL